MSETDDVQLNLKWDNFSSHLALSFDSCYESQQFVDVSLVCKEGEIIKGHKVILANTSKFFRRLLTENDHPHPMIVLHNIDVDDLRSLMTFMYCGEVQVFQNDLKKLLEIAEILEISGLQQVQEFDNPAIKVAVKNFANSNNDFDPQTEVPNNGADFEINSTSLNKSASNLLKCISTFGQKNFDDSIQSFESSSKKLQQIAQKCSNVESWSFLNHAQDNNETRIREISNEFRRETLQSSPEVKPESLNYKSSSRKLQEMARLLENTNRNPASLELCKDTSLESHKRALDFDEKAESSTKKLNLNTKTHNASETEREAENKTQIPNSSRSVTDEQNRIIQTCNVFIKDELDVATDGSTTPDVDYDTVQNDRLNILSNGEHPGTSMLAAGLLKAVANRRIDTKPGSNAIKNLFPEARRPPNGVRELRKRSKRRSVLNETKTPTVESFAKKYGLTLQLETIKEFQNFDQRLKKETEFCTDFVSTLEYLVKNKMQQTITTILKSFVTKGLAVSCTALKRSRNKMIFKSTKFNDCLFAIVRQYHCTEENKSITEKDYYQTLSSCFNNAKDWNGYRHVSKPQGAALILQSEREQKYHEKRSMKYRQS